MDNIIHEAVTRSEIQSLDFVLRLLDKYPVNMVVEELNKYKRELEQELDMDLDEANLARSNPGEYAGQVDGDA